MQTKLTWAVVDSIAERLGVGLAARRQWRRRGVPWKWRVMIADALKHDGSPTDLVAFDAMELSKPRVAK